MSRAARASAISTIIMPRSMAGVPKRKVPATVKLAVAMPPFMVPAISVAVAPGAMPSLEANSWASRISPFFAAARR